MASSSNDLIPMPQAMLPIAKMRSLYRLDEVEKRLHRVKAQASRARRYRELSERLKELRVRSTVEDFRESVAARTEISCQLYWHNFKLNHLEKLVADVSAACELKTHERQAHWGERHDRRLRARRGHASRRQAQRGGHRPRPRGGRIDRRQRDHASAFRRVRPLFDGRHPRQLHP